MSRTHYETETVKCENCGHVNEVTRATCKSCTNHLPVGAGE